MRDRGKAKDSLIYCSRDGSFNEAAVRDRGKARLGLARSLPKRRFNEAAVRDRGKVHEADTMLAGLVLQ